MKNNLINLINFKKDKKRKMLVLILIIVAILAITIWDNYVENPAISDVQIPESKNISFNISRINAIAPSDIINEIEVSLGKPVLLYFYTTWCGICKKQLPVINEMARKFQRTDLKIIAVAVDRNIDEQSIINYLDFYGNIYFKPSYLAYSDGLIDLLSKKSIEYNNKIPLTVLISKEGKIITRFVGLKSEDFLNRKIIRAL